MHSPTRHRRLAILIGIGGIFALAACLLLASPTPGGVPPSPTVADLTPTAIPPDTPTPTPQPDSLSALAAAQLPVRDRYDLARRLQGMVALPTVRTTPAPYNVGDVASFWVQNTETAGAVQVAARLVYTTDHVAMWVEEGLPYDRQALIAAAGHFEQDIYPTDRFYFGSEASPGIDGDIRLHILNTSALDASVLGFFYSPSEYPASLVPYSNEREMFYINLNALDPATPTYDAVLAHEFQHMIHWNVDRNEEAWMNEGLSELAAFLNGYGVSGFVPYFLLNPDLQLNTWPENGIGAEHYGAAFLFNAYFLDRCGPEALREMVADPANGLDGLDRALNRCAPGTSTDDFFGQWVIANLLRDPSVPPGIYTYTSLPDLPDPGIAQAFHTYPVTTDTLQVHQYGADYISLYGPARLTLRFTGETTARIIPTDTANTDGDPATPDSFVWWSNRGDESDMTLTHSLDLTGAAQARLEFDLWYWLEDGWDYGYVEASADGGQTWAILKGNNATDANPHGQSYGPGYTGTSAAQPGANAEGWLHEAVDLSAYAGRVILLRFETITDDAVNLPGIAVDNICVTAVGFCDNVEGGSGEWKTQGFVRHDNALPQRFLVQIILPADDDSVTVIPFPLDADNQGEITITAGSQQPATLVISGLTRYTTQTAEYRLEITPAGG